MSHRIIVFCWAQWALNFITIGYIVVIFCFEKKKHRDRVDPGGAYHIIKEA